MRRVLLTLSALALAALLLVPLPLASASVAPLFYAGCIANNGAWGCEDPARDSLAAAADVAVSPDGNNVYVVSSFNFEQPQVGGNAITTFLRLRGGALLQLGCIANPGPRAPAGCEILPQASLLGAERVVVSADGRNLYVLSRGGGVGQPSAITELARAPDGQLSFLGCISADVSTGCSAFPHHGLEERTTISAIAISPDGSDVYVTSSESSSATGAGPTSLSWFHRGAEGLLTESGCVAPEGTGGCSPMPEGWYFGALAISPDGAELYVVGNRAVEQFAIDADGAPSLRGCFGYGYGSGCPRSSRPSFFEATQIVAAPDGRSIYLGGSSSLAELSRAADGSLSLSSCLSTGKRGLPVVRGCATTRRGAVGASSYGGAEIAVGVDGRVYLANSGVSIFGHRADGRLVERGCIANPGRGGRILTPACARAGRPSLRGADGIAVSPNGHDVYVASLTGLSVTWFRRAR